MDSFGSRLKHARNRKGLTQDELAERIGRTGKQIVSRWEKDQNEPSLALIRQLAEILDTTVSFLVDGIPEESTKEVDLSLIQRQQDKINQLQEQVIQLQNEKIALQNQQLERLKNIEGVPDKP